MSLVERPSLLVPPFLLPLILFRFMFFCRIYYFLIFYDFMLFSVYCTFALYPPGASKLWESKVLLFC